MFKLSPFKKSHQSALLSSELFDEDTFYLAFADDLSKCKTELIIESPFITGRRIRALLPSLRGLVRRGVRITINTREPDEHDLIMRAQAEEAVSILQVLGVKVLFTVGHHRKIAVIDKSILWEGSLNILSQHSSCEVMRRIESRTLAKQMIAFAKLGDFVR